MSRELILAAAAQLEAEIGSARTVYAFGVPDGSLPVRYLMVTGNIGETLRPNMADVESARTPVLWVTSVARDTDARTASEEALWGAERARAALVGWRPTVGRKSWKPVHETSSPVRPDDSLPSVTVMFTVDQYRIQYQP